ncbi:MAG: hypothetical protein K6T31_02950 [Alicyclobacillus sp.]|nr:hypothetical protein [Alicyclobacillus sp.]
MEKTHGRALRWRGLRGCWGLVRTSPAAEVSDGYWLLLAASLWLDTCSGLRLALPLVWLPLAIRSWLIYGRRAAVLPRRGGWVWRLLLRQSPGGLAAVASWLAVQHGAQEEWASIALALWVHPFLPWWERLPAGHWHGLAVSYWMSLFTPALITAFSLAVAGWAHRRMHHESRRKSGSTA